MPAARRCHEHATQAEPLWRWRLQVVVMLLLCGLLDFSTGSELSVFLLYVLPVALATRWLGATAGVWTALAAGAIWVTADVASGHVYSQPWVLWVNAANRTLTFLMAVAMARLASRDRDQALGRWRRLTQGLTVCRACDKLRSVDDQWRTPLQHFEELGRVTPATKVCADCARRGYARPAQRDASHRQPDDQQAHSA